MVEPGPNKAHAQGTTLNDVLPKLNNIRYLSLMDVSSGHHDLRLDDKSSYLTTFACQLGRYRCN